MYIVIMPQTSLSFLANELISFLSSDSQSIIYFNARRLRKHFDEIHNLLSSFDNHCSIIAITDSWLSDDDKDLYCFPSYSPEYCHRLTSNHGGAALFVSSNISYKRRYDLDISVTNCESVFIEFDPSFLNIDGKSFICGCIYRSPSTSIPEFCLALHHSLNSVCLENKNMVILGDININLLDNTSPGCINYTNTIHSFGFECLINIPTRHSSTGGSSLIDHALSNLLTPPLAGVLDIDITDHCPIFIKFNSTQPQRSFSFVKSILDKEKFVEAIAKVDWSEVMHTDDTQKAYSQFLLIISSCLLSNSCTRKCKKHFPFAHNPWMTDTLLSAMRRRDNFYKQKKNGKRTAFQS